MKKYVKPDLFFEKFELSRQIAACYFDLNQADKESCSEFVDPMFGVIVLDAVKCKGYTIVDEYCYYPASGSEFKTFNS